MPTPASVLVFGRDFQLVHTRSLILEKAGFDVQTASSLPDIQQLLSEPTTDVMLLCHSLSSHDCKEALNIAHKRWPNIRTIAPPSPAPRLRRLFHRHHHGSHRRPRQAHRCCPPPHYLPPDL